MKPQPRLLQRSGGVALLGGRCHILHAAPAGPRQWSTTTRVATEALQSELESSVEPNTSATVDTAQNIITKSSGKKSARAKSGSRKKQGAPKESTPFAPILSNAYAIAGDLLSRGITKLQTAPNTVASNTELIKLLAALDSKMSARGRTLLALPLTGRNSRSAISMELVALPMRTTPGGSADLVQGAAKAASLLAAAGDGYTSVEAPVEGRTFQVKATSDPSSVARALMKQLGQQANVTMIAAGKDALSCSLNAVLELRANLLYELGVDCGWTTEFIEATSEAASAAANSSSGQNISAFYRLVIHKRELPTPVVAVSHFTSKAVTLAAGGKATSSDSDSEASSPASNANAMAARMMVGGIMQLLMKRPKLELHCNESELPFTLRTLVRVVELSRQARGGGNVVAMLQPRIVESSSTSSAKTGANGAEEETASAEKSNKVVILLERTKLPDLSSATLPVETGVVKQYTPQDSLQKALRAQMLNLGSWNARLDSPRALPTMLEALRGVDAELSRNRGTRVAFVPEMVLEERVKESKGNKGGKRRNSQQKLQLHFIELDSMIKDMLKPRQVTTTYKVMDVPHLNMLVRTTALYNSFPSLVAKGSLGLYSYLSHDNLLHVDLCKDQVLDMAYASTEGESAPASASGNPASWPSLLVAATTDETALARGVLAEVLQSVPGESGVTLRTGYGEPVKVAMVAVAMAAPPLQDQTNSRILVVPKLTLVQEQKPASSSRPSQAAAGGEGEKPSAASKGNRPGAKTFAITLLGLHKCPLATSS